MSVSAAPARRPRRRWLRVLILVVSLLALLAVSLAIWLVVRLRASLPQLEGEAVLPGAGAAVTVDRDALGVPTIRADTELDALRALGWLHAQDRFFQMDLQRRAAAGELAELLGPALVPIDARRRVHRFRQVAQRALAILPAGQRVQLEAYTAGVNAGLAALRRPPFEHTLLFVEPQPWLPEDSLLCGLAMYLQLQDATPTRELDRAALRAALPEPVAAWLQPVSNRFEAPVRGIPAAIPQLPGPSVIDLRTGLGLPASRPTASAAPLEPDDVVVGSNAWAAAGALADGPALVAVDTHLALGVPHIWYRAALFWPEDGAPRRVVGVTLPGMPGVVYGSNGRVAWGFTNAGVDTADAVVVVTDPADADRYLAPEGSLPFESVTELIRVRGGEPERIHLRMTLWGPVVDEDAAGRPVVHRWIAHLPVAVNLGLLRMHHAASVDDALDVAAAAALPVQNLVVGDASGSIAWTLAGPLPERFGHDGFLPSSWEDGTRGWRLATAARVPVVLDPENHLVWTANSRVDVTPEGMALGDGGFDPGFRSSRIRHLLTRIRTPATPVDMLAIQLDDDAEPVYGFWQRALLAALERGPQADPVVAEVRRHVTAWGGRASVDSVGFRIVRGVREATLARLFAPYAEAARSVRPSFRWNPDVPPGAVPTTMEEPARQLLEARPEHLLPPPYRDYDQILLDALSEVVRSRPDPQAPLDDFTWGRRNAAQIRHPLSLAAPFLGRWLDMPADELPGDSRMPRAQSPAYGASQRLAVQPGREEQGVYHQPGGASGHPFSPFYRAGHAAWVRGEPTPFLPGPPVHTLVLNPAGETR